MVNVLIYFAKKYSKPFTWKYFSTSHGKGVVDAIGGNAKSMVKMQLKSKSAEGKTVNSAKDFIKLAEKSLRQNSLK